jgi:hypothetical protein
MIQKKIIIFIFFVFVSQVKAQLLSISEVTTLAVSSSDRIGEHLLKAGWKNHNIEFVKDSNFVKRTWMIPTSRADLNNYFIHYEFNNDTAENYVRYQFSDRKAFLNYKKELSDLGYKHLNGGKSRKKGKSKDDHIHKEKEDMYYNEKAKTLTVVKEVFYYGLFSFLIQSYKAKSAFAEHAMNPNKK